MVCSAAPIYNCNEGDLKNRTEINVSFMIKAQRMSEEIYFDVATLLLGCKWVISLMHVLFLSHSKFYITVVEKKRE
jgi:hypothetical protein